MAEPFTTALNIAFEPTQVVWEVGSVTIEAGVFTDKVASLEVMFEGQSLLISTLYLLLLNATFTLLMVKILKVSLDRDKKITY